MHVKENIVILANDIRNISHSILPSALNDGDFILCIQDEIEKMNTNDQSCKIQFYNFGIKHLFNPQFASTIYLICLELIYNAKRHGQATEIVVEVYDYPEEYVFQISDNGIGLKPDFKKGFELNTIEERILNLKGVFDLITIPNTGFQIQITTPKSQ